MGRRHFNVFIIIFCIQTLRVECGSTSSVTWEAWWMTHNASSTCPFPWQIPLQRSLLQLWKGINIGMRCVLISKSEYSFSLFRGSDAQNRILVRLVTPFTFLRNRYLSPLLGVERECHWTESESRRSSVLWRHCFYFIGVQVCSQTKLR